MPKLTSIPALRIFIFVVGAFAIVSVALHSILLSRRKFQIELKGEARKSRKIEFQDPFNTPATIPEEYLKSYPNISRHDFKYLQNPHNGKFCQKEMLSRSDGTRDVIVEKKKKQLLILFMVHTKAEHFEHRRTIRETWGSVGKRLTEVVFLLGNPGNASVQRMVVQEGEEHGDIVQEDFLETYRNITLKNIMGLKWASKHCAHAKYVVKADDDMFINTKLLISTLINSRLPRKRLILCKIHFFKNVPREGKYVIDKSLYSADYWPSFCFGGCWIASMDVVQSLYEISLQTKQIYLDDVFVTGILRTKLSLPINYVSRAYTLFCHTRGNYNLVREMWEALTVSQRKEKNSLQKNYHHYVDFWSLCFK